MKGLLSILITFLLISCGRDYADPTLNSVAEIGSKFEVSSVVSNEDLTVGRKICDALRSKRIKIQTGVSLSQVSYNVVKNDCGGVDSSYNVSASISRDVAGNPTLTPSSSGGGELRGGILTDERGVLTSFCSEVFAGQSPSVVKYPSSMTVEYIEFIFSLS